MYREFDSHWTHIDKIRRIMSYIKHAIREFKAVGWMDEDGNYLPDDKDGDEPSMNLQELVCKNTLTLLEVLEEQSYSAATIGYALSLFTKLAKFKPLSEITDNESEWREISKDGTKQNIRMSSIFMRDDGIVWDQRKVAFRRKSENAEWTCGGPNKYNVVELPYSPADKPELIILEDDEEVEKIPLKK